MFDDEDNHSDSTYIQEDDLYSLHDDSIAGVKENDNDDYSIDGPDVEENNEEGAEGENIEAGVEKLEEDSAHEEDVAGNETDDEIGAMGDPDGPDGPDVQMD
jgi:hypothetical protein